MKKISEDLKYFFSGSIFLGFSSIFSLAVPLIVIPYLIKTVGLSNYGLSVVAFSVMYFISLVVDFGYNITGVSELAKATSNEKKNEIIIYALCTKTILFLILLGGFLVALVFIPYLRTHFLLFLFSLLIPFTSILNLNWALQGIQKIKLLSLLTLLGKVVYLISIFLSIRSADHFIYINALYALGVFVSGLVSLYFIHKQICVRFVPFNMKRFWAEVRASGHYFVSNISIHLSLNLFPVILSFFVKSEIVGIFSVVEKIYNLVRSIFSIYINLMLPRISALVVSSLSRAVDVLKKTYVFVIAFVLLQIIIVFLFKMEIIGFFIEDFGELAATLLQISMLGIIILVFNCPIYILLLALDRRKEIMNTFLIGPLVGILFCTVLSKYYGIFGAFTAIIVTELFYAITLNYLYHVRKGLFAKKP